MTAPLARRLAEYADGLEYGDLGEETVHETKRRVLDSLACAYAGLDEAPVGRVRAYAARKRGDPNASVIHGEPSSVEYATLANGTMIRFVDWNDMYTGLSAAHPSDNLGPVLSVADAYGRSGEETILATVLAYELQCQFADRVALWRRGFDHVNHGLISSTLAAGTLMGLSAEELTQAVNIALAGHVALRQTRAGQLSDWKGIAFSNAARNGVVAAEFAREGIDGPSPIFEGELGYFNGVSGELSVDPEGFGSGPDDFKLNETAIKYYPVGYHIQPAVEAALDLREAHDIDPRSIDRIEIETYEEGVAITGEGEEKWRPETRNTADHSIPYGTARALLDGEMTTDQFALEKIRDPDVRALMDTIEVTENEEFSERYGESVPHRMRIHADGETRERTLDAPTGHPITPLSDEELAGKFRSTAGKHLPDERIGEVERWVWEMDEKDDLSGLFSLL